MSESKSFVYQSQEELTPPIQAKCLVHFRPKEQWEGKDYGFDWMRIADTLVAGDTQPYEEIVGKLFKEGTNTLVTNINTSEGRFEPNAAMYNDLKKEYNPLTITWKTVFSGDYSKLGEYFCPRLSLYPSESKALSPLRQIDSDQTNTEADLRLFLDIAEIPDYIEFEENKHFKITPPKISDDLRKGEHFWKSGDGKETVKIKCLTDFNTDQKIDVFAVKKDAVTGRDDRKLAGRLYVWANDRTKRKKVKCLLVKVTTPPLSGSRSKTGNTKDQPMYFKRYLRQALITVDTDDTVELNLSSDPNFMKASGNTREGTYITGYKINYRKSGISTPLIKYLDDRLIDKLRKEGKDANMYNGIFKVYYFEEESVFTDNNGYQDGNAAVFFKRDDQTAVHEFLHRLNLSHSYSNKECSLVNKELSNYKADYTYKAKKTDNVMDYSFQRYSLWKWQWRVINNSI